MASRTVSAAKAVAPESSEKGAACRAESPTKAHRASQTVMPSTVSQIADVTVRLRPGFVPFVEPGFELDIQCMVCGGEGCPVCKHSGWVELLPCGLVHPNVLRSGGINPDEYGGFAFGLGLTRLVMMRYLIDDIRWLQSGDLRFLKQF